MSQKGWKRLCVMLPLVVLIGTLSGCDRGEDSEDAEALPTQYVMGEEEVAALSVEEGADVQEVTEERMVYTYTGLEDAGAACAAYAKQLRGDEEAPFVVVDETFTETKSPDFTAEAGTTYLARTTEEEGELCVIQLDWAEATCIVTMKVQEGEIQRVEATADEQSSSVKMTLMDAVDYLNSFSPSALGLEGDSMSQYQIYALDGVIYVDGQACLHLKACSADNPQKTNEIAGSFLLTGDQQHIYRYDEANGTVEELGT